MRYSYLILLSFLFVHCKDALPPQNQGPSDIQTNNDKITIIDRTGKSWDITDAVNRFGFKPSKFQFGLGPNAIPPIINPQFHCPEDAGYPSASQPSIVIGTSINDITRAYPLFILKSHEIVDDSFGDAHVAVAY